MRTPVERLNKARGLCGLAHDTVQLAPEHPLSEALEQLRQAIEEIAAAVESVDRTARAAANTAGAMANGMQP